MEKHQKIAFSWDDASTELLLSHYKELSEGLKAREIKTKKLVWEKLTKILMDQGYEVTCIQVENKFKSLERSYKGMVLNNKKTGREHATCRYEKELTEILGKKYNINPVAVMGSTGLIIKHNQDANEMLQVEVSDIDDAVPVTEAANNPKQQKTVVHKHSLRKKNRYSSTSDNLKQYHETMKEFTTAVLAQNERKLILQREMLKEQRLMRKELKRSNDLKQETNEILKRLVD